MNSQFLTEAFKELDLLTEDEFALDKDGVDDLGKLISLEDDTVDIIDDEAESEEELEDSYIGKVVLDCCVCHSKIYKDADSVVIDDSQELANVGEECPYCYSVDGFKIIGQIEPFEEEAELKVEVEDKDEVEDGDAEEEVEEKEEEEVDESLKKKSVKEEFERVELETEDKIIKVSEEEKEEIPDEEMITPLDLDTEKEIVDSTNEENEEEEAEQEAEDEFIDQDFDEFEEEDFDELGESYLKKVYDNVNSFRTSKVSTKGNTLKVEGIIKFNSGNEKATTFLFEAKDITKNGKVRFIGENQQITRGKKAFTLNGKIDGKKLIAESLNYNYRAKNADGKSVRLYGTIKGKLTEAKLSDVKGTASNAMSQKEVMAKLSKCTTAQEVKALADKVIPEDKKNEPKVKKLLLNLTKANDVVKAQTTFTNFILKGDGLGVI